MIEACSFKGNVPGEDAHWVPIVPHKAPGASAHHFFPCDNSESRTHLRLHIFRDGGVSRLRLFGTATTWNRAAPAKSRVGFDPWLPNFAQTAPKSGLGGTFGLR